jgi:hypothetical protein
MWKLFSYGRTQIEGVWEQGAEPRSIRELYSSTAMIEVIKSSGMGEACSTHGRDYKCVPIFTQKIWKEEATWGPWV